MFVHQWPLNFFSPRNHFKHPVESVLQWAYSLSSNLCDTLLLLLSTLFKPKISMLLFSPLFLYNCLCLWHILEGKHALHIVGIQHTSAEWTHTSSSETTLRRQVPLASLWVFFEMYLRGNPFLSICVWLCRNLCEVIQWKRQKKTGDGKMERNLFYFRKYSTNADNYLIRLHWKMKDCAGELTHLKAGDGRMLSSELSI